MWILLALIAVGSVIYVGFAEVSLGLYDESNPRKAPGLLYDITTRIMLFGLFVAGVCMFIFCKRLEKIRM